jgi:predicted ATPase/DNA-binding SARP family transcriptional activator
LQLGVLGPLQVTDDDGARVVLGSWRQRLLLAVLIAGRGRTFQPDELAEALWSEALPADPRAAVQSHVSRLRKRLGGAGAWIETTTTGYRLVDSPGRLDRAHFEQSFGYARDLGGPPTAVLDQLDEALRLWRGRAFQGLADHAAIGPEAMRLDELRTEAVELRAESLLALGRVTEAGVTMRELTADHPFRERPVAILIRALARDGRHADALYEYDRFRRLLDAELGLVPSPVLQTVQREVLRHGHPSGRGSPIGLPGNSFVGRDRELTTTRELLRGGRLVTLTGPGGVGKSRLALHVAAGMTEDYPDGIHLCELAGVPDGGDAIAAVASILRVDERAKRSLLDRVTETLQLRRALLLLDNCEHVRSTVAELVTMILRSAAQVDVLATSRERLGVEGERRLPVGPLTTPAADRSDSESVRLFIDRVRELRPDVALGPEDLETVSDLCRRLDGLPLAIELATAQSVGRSPSEMYAALIAHHRELTDPRRTVARHRSLEAAFDWSYQLLAPREQQAFERLAVFRGGWTGSAAATVASLADEELLVLVERSLVVASSTGRDTRFAMLEPVRQYAEARLQAQGGLEQTRARHATWAVAFSEAADAGLRDAEETAWRRRLDAELANLRAAHRWSLDRDPESSLRLTASLYRYMWCGAPSEVYAWPDDVVERGPDPAHPRAPAAYAAAALGAWHRGDLARARSLAEAGTTMGGPEPAATRLAWEALGDVETFLGEFERAIATFGTALALARTASDDHQTAIVLLDRAMCSAYLGSIGDAIADCEAASSLVAALGNPTLQAWSDYTNGEIRLEHAPEQALPYLRSSAAAARRIGNRLIMGVAGLSAVSCEARVGQPAAALGQYRELIDHWQCNGAWNMQWATLRTFIELLERLGRDADAAVLHGALTMSEKAPPSAGADTVRIAEVVAGLRRRLGSERFGRLTSHGANLSEAEAVEFARECAATTPPARSRSRGTAR